MASVIVVRRTVAATAAVVALAACGGGYEGTSGGTGPGGPVVVKPAKWALAWADEFDGPAIDAASWIAVDGPANVNNELEYFTPSDAYVENGSLVLRSQRRDFGGRSYTSAEVRSGTKRTVRRGNAIEWRTQIPTGKGIWPANWLVNTPCDGLGGCGGVWPPEIDVMEIRGSAPDVNYMTHWWGTYPAQQHLYRVEWFADSIVWYIDGTQRAKHTTNITVGTLQIVMNTAVGGDFDGAPDGTTVFPQYQRVDYVRVYRDTANAY